MTDEVEECDTECEGDTDDECLDCVCRAARIKARELEVAITALFGRGEKS